MLCQRPNGIRSHTNGRTDRTDRTGIREPRNLLKLRYARSHAGIPSMFSRMTSGNSRLSNTWSRNASTVNLIHLGRSERRSDFAKFESSKASATHYAPFGYRDISCIIMIVILRTTSERKLLQQTPSTLPVDVPVRWLDLQTTGGRRRGVVVYVHSIHLLQLAGDKEQPIQTVTNPIQPATGIREAVHSRTWGQSGAVTELCVPGQ